MKPGRNVLVTVILSEYAETLTGMPAQGPVGSGKLRGVLAGSEGQPKVPSGPRVSTMGQGVISMKGKGEIGVARVPSLRTVLGELETASVPAAGCQKAGAGQFGMDSPPRTRPVRKTEIKPKNEALRVSTQHLLKRFETERCPAEVD